MRIETDPGAQLGEAVAATLFHAPSLRQADHRLDARDRGAEPRGRPGLLPPLLHARQCDPRRGRRRDGRRGPARRRETYGQIERAGEAPVRAAAAGARSARRAPRQPGRPQGRAAIVAASWLVPSYPTAKPGEAEALDVLVQILGAQLDGTLHRRLVVEKRVAVAAGGLVSGHCRRPLAVHDLRRAPPRCDLGGPRKGPSRTSIAAVRRQGRRRGRSSRGRRPG